MFRSLFGDPKPYFVSRECMNRECGFAELYEALLYDESDAYSHIVECPQCDTEMEAIWVRQQVTHDFSEGD